MSEVKPVLYLGTKLVPYEERTFRIADLRDAMGYTHDHKQFYSEEQVQKLLAENERLRGEVETAQRGRAHTEQWYAERLEPIKEVAKREGLWPEIAAIIANGSGTRQLPDGSFFFDPPTYAQQLNAAKHKAEASEARAERLAEALRNVMPFAEHTDYCGDHDAYNNVEVRSCGCGLDGIRDEAYAALDQEGGNG